MKLSFTWKNKSSKFVQKILPFYTQRAAWNNLTLFVLAIALKAIANCEKTLQHHLKGPTVNGYKTGGAITKICHVLWQISNKECLWLTTVAKMISTVTTSDITEGIKLIILFLFSACKPPNTTKELNFIQKYNIPDLTAASVWKKGIRVLEFSVSFLVS